MTGGHDMNKKVKKAKKSFLRFENELFKKIEPDYRILMSEEDLAELSYLHDLIMFLVEKNIDFIIVLDFIVPTTSSVIEISRFEFESFNNRFYFFYPGTDVIPKEKGLYDLKMEVVVMICSEVSESLLNEISERFGLKFEKSDMGSWYGGYYKQYWTKVHYISEVKEIVFENFTPIKIFFALGG
jgi:hypothetical protein